jgi:hypothetical protein
MLESKNFSVVRFVCLLGLFGLMYLFHQEIVVKALVLYNKMSPSPAIEHRIANYYRGTARLNSQTAYGLYLDAMKHYEELLKNASISDKVLINVNIAKLYECGKGVLPNLLQAKSHYEQALANAEQAKNEKSAVDEKIVANIKQSLTDVQSAIDQNKPLLCPFKTQIFSDI